MLGRGIKIFLDMNVEGQVIAILYFCLIGLPICITFLAGALWYDAQMKDNAEKKNDWTEEEVALEEERESFYQYQEYWAERQ